ncbi:MAG: hypothetical protein V4772_23075 [Pseudomonadota bacterium]
MTISPDTDSLSKIIDFLTAIGLAPVATAMDGSSLLPGVDIADGQLIYDPARLLWPGDLLHEAGHIAVMPPALRPTLGGTLPDEAMAPHAGEVEATAWAYAAALAAGIAPEVLFHSGGYKGQSESLVLTYSLGVYPGVAGLIAAGLAASPVDAKTLGLAAYPVMLRWLRQ